MVVRYFFLLLLLFVSRLTRWRAPKKKQNSEQQMKNEIESYKSIVPMIASSKIYTHWVWFCLQSLSFGSVYDRHDFTWLLLILAFKLAVFFLSRNTSDYIALHRLFLSIVLWNKLWQNIFTSKNKIISCFFLRSLQIVKIVQNHMTFGWRFFTKGYCWILKVNFCRKFKDKTSHNRWKLKYME